MAKSKKTKTPKLTTQQILLNQLQQPSAGHKNGKIPPASDSKPVPVSDLILNESLQNFATSRIKLLDSMLDPRRDYNKECGYPNEITLNQYINLYEREGIATRVVNVKPQESWAMDPRVYENENEDEETPFEARVKVIIEINHLWHYCEQLDVLSGIGSYGVLLLGIDDGKPLDQPAAGILPNGRIDESEGEERELLYLRAFPESLITVNSAEKEQDVNNPRYGWPTFYNIQFADIATGGSVEQKVHWSRVLHYSDADNREGSEITAAPRMRPVYNRLLDLHKTYGGSAEMFWKGGFPGLSFELDPTMASEGLPIDREGLRAEIEAYQNKLQRYLAVVGLRTKSLAVQVADPRPHIDTEIEAICVTIGVPKRVFMGSEEASLASSQDQRTWNKRLMRRQNKNISPWIIRPLIHRLMALRVLPRVESFLVQWPDLNLPTDEDKAKVAEMRTRALAEYVQKDVSLIINPLDYLTKVQGFSTEDAVMIVENAAKGIKKLEDPEELFGGGKKVEPTQAGGAQKVGKPTGARPKPRAASSRTTSR